MAHHEPIWDRDYLGAHEYALESLAWISPKLTDALRVMSPGPEVFNAGPAAYRPHAETLLGMGPGLDALPWTRFNLLHPDHRRFVVRIVDALLAEPVADPRDVVHAWIGSTPGSTS